MLLDGWNHPVPYPQWWLSWPCNRGSYWDSDTCDFWYCSECRSFLYHWYHDFLMFLLCHTYLLVYGHIRRLRRMASRFLDPHGLAFPAVIWAASFRGPQALCELFTSPTVQNLGPLGPAGGISRECGNQQRSNKNIGMRSAKTGREPRNDDRYHRLSIDP